MALVAAVASFGAAIHHAYLSGHFNRYHRGPMDSANVSTVLRINQVQPWMTFDYINRIYNLPPDYLKQHLSIQDERYPNVQIKRYARKNKFDGDSFIETVQDKIRNHYEP